MTAVEAFELERRDPDCLEPEAIAELLQPAPWRRLAVIGDSVAAGVREPVDGYRELSFADRIAAALALDSNDERRTTTAGYLNLGARDARLAEIEASQLSPALAFEPDLALVSAGGNDAIGRRFSAERVRDGLTSVVGALINCGADVVTIGLFDLARSGLVVQPHAGAMAARFDALDEITAGVARELGAIHADSHHHPRAADRGIFSSDLIHANARGHAIAATVIVRALAGALASVP